MVFNAITCGYYSLSARGQESQSEYVLEGGKRIMVAVCGKPRTLKGERAEHSVFKWFDGDAAFFVAIVKHPLHACVQL